MKKRPFLFLVLSLVLVTALALPVFAEEGGEGGDGGGTPDIPVHEHAYGTGTVTQAPTCTQAGVMTYTCSCGESRTESIAIAPDAHNFVMSGDAEGHRSSCSRCGTVQSSGAHTWDNGTVTPATCVSAGVKQFKCTVCGYAGKSEVIAATGVHDYGSLTKIDDSTHNRKCKNCSQMDTAASHTWSSKIAVAATCKAEGRKDYACVCGAAKSEKIEKLTTHTYDNICDDTCNVCELTREIKHNISNAWSRNSRHHWHECTVCKLKFDDEPHYPGPAATEDQDQLCLVCGLLMTPKKGHVHKYQETFTSNESGHWYACEGCTDQKDMQEHVYDNECDPDCNVCGYMTDYAHYYGDTLLSNEAEHWGVCTICGVEGSREAHIPGEEATADSPQTCIICGLEMAPATNHVHEVQTGSWTYDTQTHRAACSCGEVMQEGPHTWGQGRENEDGSVSSFCTQCGAERLEAAPQADSAFPVWILVVLGVLLVCTIAAVVALILVIKNAPGGKYKK